MRLQDADVKEELSKSAKGTIAIIRQVALDAGLPVDEL